MSLVPQVVQQTPMWGCTDGQLFPSKATAYAHETVLTLMTLATSNPIPAINNNPGGVNYLHVAGDILPNATEIVAVLQDYLANANS